MSLLSSFKATYLKIFNDELSKDGFRQNILQNKYAVSKDKVLLVMGNGPSLANINMSRVSKSIDTVGMNVAFRYWNNIDWYPKYYSCLDTVVVEHHHQDIADLYRSKNEKGIDLFYLQKNILNKQPWLKDEENIIFLDDWFGSYLYSKCPSVTTGSYSVLLAIALGYKKIYLIGIDLNYIEIIKNAVVVGENLLEMRSKPSKNPNYFFDDYQLPGDQYHIPNSVPNLLITSWIEIHKLAKELNISIYNGSKDSEISDLFPFKELENVIYRNGKNYE
jgi:hypothetical protein